MALYFVRHGQTDWNAEKRIMGRTDIPLNEQGRRQAEEVRNNLANKALVAIFASPLSRALETAKIIAEKHSNVSLTIAPELIERDFGEFEGLVNDGNYFFGLWSYGNDDETIKQGETTKQVQQRVDAFIDRIRGEYEDNDALLVAHGGVGVMIEAYFRGLPEDGNLLSYASGNGEVRKYERRNDV